MSGPGVTPVEQRRRDLKAADPELYAYIGDVEAAKALDSAGDRVSGRGYLGAANLLWAWSGARRRRGRQGATSRAEVRS